MKDQRAVGKEKKPTCETAPQKLPEVDKSKKPVSPNQKKWCGRGGGGWGGGGGEFLRNHRKVPDNVEPPTKKKATHTKAKTSCL